MYGKYKKVRMLAIKGIKKGLDLNELDSRSKLKLSISKTETIEISRGSLYEWGIPAMNYGRIVIVRMLASLCTDEWILWCHGNSQTRVNHESFLAHGICPDKFRIAYTDRPMNDLRAAILSPKFKFIVIDEAQDLNDLSLAFLHHKAKELKKIVFIIRPYYLSSKKGCIWSKLRFNIDHKSMRGKIRVRAIKGHQDYSVEY